MEIRVGRLDDENYNMQACKGAGSAQRFLSYHAAVRTLSNVKSSEHRAFRASACERGVKSSLLRRY
jgi:hypothetical protein